MADEAKQDDAHVFTDNGDGVVREWDADLNHVATHQAGDKSPGTVSELLSEGYAAAEAAKQRTQYQPFKW